MAVQPSTPLRFGAIFRGAVRTYRSSFALLLLLALIVELPLLVVGEGVDQLVPIDLDFTSSSGLTLDIGDLVRSAWVVLGHHLLSGMVEGYVAADRHGHPPPRLGSLLRHLPWLRLVVGDVLLTFLTYLGFMAFLVPGLLVATWYGLTLPLINLERRGVLASFRRSRQLVRGHFWKALVVLLLINLGGFLVTELIAEAVHALSHATAVQRIGHVLPTLFLLPFNALVLVVLTFELVDRKGPPPGAAVPDEAAPDDQVTSGRRTGAPPPAATDG